MRVMVLFTGMLLLFQYVWAQSVESDGEASIPLAEITDPAKDELAISITSSASSDSPSISQSHSASGAKTKQDERPTAAPRSSNHTHLPHASTARPAISFSHITHSAIPSPGHGPRPLPPPPPSPPDGGWGHRPQPKGHHPSVVAIVFEVIAGLAGLFLIYTFGRCYYSWKRTPQRDRIENLLSRHYIRQEMEERTRLDLENRLSQFRAASPTSRPPPPPYQPAPAYDAAVAEESRV